MTLLALSLVESAVLLAAACAVAMRRRFALTTTIVLMIGCTTVPFLMCISLPAVYIQSFFLFVLFPLILFPRRGPRMYISLAVLATLMAYAIVLTKGYERTREIERLRQQYPFVSIEDRLPHRKGPSDVPIKDQAFLHELEEILHNRRETALINLHDHSVNEFVNSVGFGVSRSDDMGRKPTTKNLALDRRFDTVMPQDDYFRPSQSADQPTVSIPDRESRKLLSLHTKGVLDFVNPNGFGYVKSRKEVAGFEPHGMTKTPEEQRSWQIVRIELIGLVMHDEPVVYVSESLPRMKELLGRQVRPLDAFEKEGLERLQKGDDLFSRGADRQARMIGAIRSAKQCLQCHDGPRGELLGAFSYRLRRDSPPSAP